MDHSYDLQGPLGYLKDRALRLLVPAIIFDVLLAPLLCVISRDANGFDVPAGLSGSESTFVWYWQTFVGVGRNPTW